MIKPRFIYFLLVVLTIIIGLLSRQTTLIPKFTGDILWALMVYFIVRLLFIKKTVKFIVTGSLLFCYAIEFSQLYKAPWIDNLRHTIFGRLVLGDTFLWGDLLCYTVGVAIGIRVDLWLLQKPSRQNQPLT